jgi:alkanesulfonate monooxygenase
MRGVTSDFLWYLPTHGDGRNLSSGAFHKGTRGNGFRPPHLDYLKQVALAAESAGFLGALIPTGTHCEDAWAVAAAVSEHTTRLKPLLAFRPGFVLPAVAAHTVASLQRFTGNRLLLNVVTGGNSTEQQAYGDFLGHDARYERTDEFLSVVRGVWAGRGFNFEGKHYRVQNGGLVEPLESVPTIYFGGASPAAERVAAKHADVYLTWGETPPMIQPRIASLRAQAATHGRTLRFGVRIHLISHDTEAEAWAEAQRLLESIPEGAIEEAQRQFALSESVGQSRMVGLHHGRLSDARQLEVYPNIWAGIGLVRGGAGTAVIGSHEQVAARIAEYEALGVDTFIFSAYPNLEEAVRLGEDLLPLLSAATTSRQPARELSLVGAS